MNYQDEINRLIPLLPHKSQVRFAFYCAKDVSGYAEAKYRSGAQRCLDLTEAWLEGKNVAPEELKAAAYSASHSAAASDYSAASYASYASVYAASSAASYAFAAASSAAYSASSSASSASDYSAYSAHSATAAYSAHSAAREERYKKYYEYLIDMLTDLEKILYNI